MTTDEPARVFPETEWLPDVILGVQVWYWRQLPSGVRLFALPIGNRTGSRRRDRHGCWKIRRADGPTLPEVGGYVDAQAAMAAADELWGHG